MGRTFRSTPPNVSATGSLLRGRLVGPLARRFEVRLVAIEAGAGFGKTTLLAQAVAENRLRPAGEDVWLGCESADASRSNLVGAVLDGLHSAMPGTATEPTVDGVCEAIWARAPTEVCIVFDDVHLLASSAGWDTLVALVEDLPANGHMVLAGRALGRLPLRQLLSKHDAISLGEDDLRFDGDELRAVARLRHVDPQVLDGVAGWPALAELRAASGGRADDDALLDEILSSLDADERRRFGIVVAVGGGDHELLSAALEAPYDPRTATALPLVRSMGDGGIEPHALWERIVSRELAPDEVRDARRRAADACARRGDNRRAFELLAATDDWDAALPVLFEASHDQVDPPWPDTLTRWRAMVPAELFDRPEVVYLDALIERADDPWAVGAREGFERVDEQLRAAGDVVRELQARLRAGFGGWLAGDPALFLENNQRLEALGGTSVTRFAHLIRLNDALLADIAIDVEGMFRAVDVEFRIEPRLDFFHPLLRGYAHLAAGDARAARPEARSAIAKAEGPFGAAGTQLCVLLDTVARWLGGDEERIDAGRFVDPGSRWSIGERVPTLAVAAVIAAHEGRVDEARVLLDAARALVPDVGERDLLAGFLGVAQATILVADGDEESATSIIEALMDRPWINGATTGRALVWFGALPALVSPRASSFVRALPRGDTRRRALGAVDGLLRVRAGESPGDVSLLDDSRALVTVLPVPLATELACGAAAFGDPRGRRVLEELRTAAPRTTRVALQRGAASTVKAVRTTAAAALAEIPIPPPEAVRVRVLGPAQLERDGVPVTDRHWRRERVRQLLLLLVDRRAMRRAEAADVLWPDLGPDAVAANLRTTLSYLHAVLEPHRRQGEAPYILQQDAGSLRLTDDEFFTVDAWEIERYLDRAAAAERDGLASRSLAHLLDALALWTGPYLDDAADEEWAVPSRRRLHERVVAAGVRAAELLVAGGRAPEATGIARTALEIDPWSEAAHRALVAAHLSSADRGAARRAIADCEAMLDDLGVEPDPATRVLMARLHDTR